MREWHLTTNDPLSLTLAADARCTQTDYLNDQIWELTLENGSPPAVAVQTTYGLRARLMRMFPRFHEGDEAFNDPSSFARRPAVQVCLPNYIRLTAAPLEGIEVKLEYWAPLSQAICGRVSIQNQSNQNRQIRADWIGQLTPTEGRRLSQVEIQGVSVLAGTTAQLAPVIFLTKGPKFGSGAYPCLSLPFDLYPNDGKSFIWAAAALETQEASFALARSLAASRWEAEMVRIEMQNAGQVEIFTGDPDWDACLMLTQKTALGLFHSGNSLLPNASIVQSRTPDQGFSLRGDGLDYNHLWSGQSILDVYCLSQILLPTVPEMISGLLENFFAVQEKDGYIDMMPGLSGQRANLLAAPLLSSLALQVEAMLEKPGFLQQLYPKLLAFFDHWFSPQYDGDHDGIPEWSNPFQKGHEDHPIYSPWNSWSQGASINLVGSPDLCAFLYRECRSLIQIAQKIGETDRIADLEETAKKLALAVERAWEAERQTYLDWDCDTHMSPEGGLLAQTSGPGLIFLQRSFLQPARLLIHIHPTRPTFQKPTIYIHGSNQIGMHRVEQITPEQFGGNIERFCYTTRSVFGYIEQIEIRDLDAGDQVSIFQVDLSTKDQSQFAPLWAGIPNQERAAELIEQNLLNPQKYWKPFGIPLCAEIPPEADPRICNAGVSFWNQIIGEALLAYGYREQAIELVSRLMRAAVQNLRAEARFRQYTDTVSGAMWGEANALNGLAPFGLFLETLGVRFFSHKHLQISGFNPYPWPVTVKYRGTQIVREKDLTTITFSDGQSLIIDDPSPRCISLEHSDRKTHKI